MSFDESAAREITAVRALESSARLPEVWADADRAWASRAAAEIVGEDASPEAFLATRARLALKRAGERFAPFPRVVRALRWRPWVGRVIVAAAFLGGLALDQVGGGRRINLLAPPFFLLLLWNVGVYALLAVGFVARRRAGAGAGPLRHLVSRMATGLRGRRSMRRQIAEAVTEFTDRWSQLSARLYAARAARVLHVAAAAFALGLVCGLYLRGIAFEYRATWESTFLGTATVHSLLATALTPGAAVSGISIPSLAELEAIRAPNSENAARWLYLIAATVALLVIAPRLALALWAGLLERHRRSHIPLALDQPYFVRLLRAFKGGPARVRVVPYSYALPPAQAAGLEQTLRGVFGANASLTIEAPVAYGGEDSLAADTQSPSPANVLALFNATATPERPAHGAFLDALARQVSPAGTLLALVDESALRERCKGEPARLEERRASWRVLCAERRIPCVFAALRGTDLADAMRELERAIDEVAR